MKKNMEEIENDRISKKRLIDGIIWEVHGSIVNTWELEDQIMVNVLKIPKTEIQKLYDLIVFEFNENLQIAIYDLYERYDFSQEELNILLKDEFQGLPVEEVQALHIYSEVEILEYAKDFFNDLSEGYYPYYTMALTEVLNEHQKPLTDNESSRFLNMLQVVNNQDYYEWFEYEQPSFLTWRQVDDYVKSTSK